jgi:hypothetical protein
MSWIDSILRYITGKAGRKWMEGGSIGKHARNGLWPRNQGRTPSEDFEPPAFPCLSLDLIIEETYIRVLVFP